VAGVGRRIRGRGGAECNAWDLRYDCQIRLAVFYLLLPKHVDSYLRLLGADLQEAEADWQELEAEEQGLDSSVQRTSFDASTGVRSVRV
jgi:hypothetical protein